MLCRTKKQLECYSDAVKNEQPFLHCFELVDTAGKDAISQYQNTFRKCVRISWYNNQKEDKHKMLTYQMGENLRN